MIEKIDINKSRVVFGLPSQFIDEKGNCWKLHTRTESYYAGQVENELQDTIGSNFVTLLSIGRTIKEREVGFYIN